MCGNKQSAIKSGSCWYNIRSKQKTKTEQNKKTKKKNAQSLRRRARQMCCHMLVLIA